MGTVIESDEASTLKPGDSVFGTAPALSGTLASIIRVPQDFCSMAIPTPTDEVARQLGCIGLAGLTAYQVLNKYGASAGDHVLIIGASGGVGHIAVQIAKLKGLLHILL